jgi:hypothetical protein
MPTADSAVPLDVPFPKYTVGLVQSESEMLQAPEYDLSAFLERDPRWDVELYTERTVQSLVGSPERVDCIVVGYNAAHKSPEIQDALRAADLNVGLCVLHQLSPQAFSFLPPAHGIRMEPMRPPIQPELAPQLVVADEVLLNWPMPVGLREGRLPHSQAHAALVPTSSDRWRTVLEAGGPDRRLPVLMRSVRGQSPPVVLCTGLLAPRHTSHAALIGNILLWCASGHPSAVVVAPRDEHAAAIMQRKLRLQGTRAVADPIDDVADLDFASWPLRGVKHALLPQRWDPTAADGWPDRDPHGARAWLRSGGRLLLFGGDDDSITVRHAESDVHWVARRWAAWFHAAPEETWCGRDDPGSESEGSIIASRAVLTLLAAFHGDGQTARVPGLYAVRGVLRELEQRDAGIDPRELGVPPPSEYLERLRRLLRRRIGDGDSVDDTVSATVAALDVDALLGGRALDPVTRERMHDWLRKRATASGDQRAALEDRLEIARLDSAESLARLIDTARDDPRLDQPLSAVLITALRSAIAACGVEPTDKAFDWLSANPDSIVADDLRTRPLLAMRYLLGLSDLQTAWSPPDGNDRAANASLSAGARAIRNPPSTTVDRAVVTVGRYGPLLHGWTEASVPSADIASTEALALIAYFGRNPAPTHVVGSTHPITPETIGSVLREAAALRVERNELQRSNRELADAKRRLERLGPVAAGVTQALVLVVIAAAWWLVATRTVTAITWEVGAMFVLWTILTLATLGWLSSRGFDLGRVDAVRDWLKGGISGIRERLGGRSNDDGAS